MAVLMVIWLGDGNVAYFPFIWIPLGTKIRYQDPVRRSGTKVRYHSKTFFFIPMDCLCVIIVSFPVHGTGIKP